MNFISGSRSSNLVAGSFDISKVIAQHGKSLSDGEYIVTMPGGGVGSGA